MRVLLIKTSSMGDIIHTLPALTDAVNAIPDIIFDWVIEESFAEIPAWHPNVDKVIPIGLRRWRKKLISSGTRQEWKKLQEELRSQHYDLVLDAQGLVKSAFIAFFTKGLRAGLDWNSAREPLASFAYQQKYNVNFYQHAVVRMRSLFSQTLKYELPKNGPQFGLDKKQFTRETLAHAQEYFVFLHSTTWESKQWPETYWVQLAELAGKVGYRIKMNGGNPEELERAKRIGEKCSAIDVLPRLEISEMAALVANSKGVVAVDTGFGHLAAALGVPTVSLYGSTNPAYTGALGEHSQHIAAEFACAPCIERHCSYKKSAVVTPACYATISPARVWEKLRTLIS